MSYEMLSFIFFLSFWGLVCSVYAIMIENGNERKKRACDLNEAISCTRVLTSKYGHMMKLGFGLSDDHPLNFSNAYYGMAFYLLLPNFYGFALHYPFPGAASIFLLMTASSVAASIGLGYILYSRLKTLCLICVVTYVINTLLFMTAFVNFVSS